MQLRIVLLGLGVAGFGSTAIANDPDLSVYPVAVHFGGVTLGSTSPSRSVTITNAHASQNLTLGTAALSGTYAGHFSIAADNCASSTLPPGGTCDIQVQFSPRRNGSLTAMLVVPTSDTETPELVAFLSNDEDTRTQSSRRLPPTLNSINIPEVMEADVPYTLEWSLIGYHDNYYSSIALFDCSAAAAGQCGANFSSNFAESGLLQPTSITEASVTFRGVAAKVANFSYQFTPSAEASFAPGDTDIVIRFYRKSAMDAAANASSLSLLVPGALTDRYYDSEGRRILKTVRKVK